MDCSLPASSVQEILQERILECLPFLSPGDLPNPGIEPGCPALQADSSLPEHQGSCGQVGPQPVLCAWGGVMAVLLSGEALALSAVVWVCRLGSTAGWCSGLGSGAAQYQCSGSLVLWGQRLCPMTGQSSWLGFLSEWDCRMGSFMATQRLWLGFMVRWDWRLGSAVGERLEICFPSWAGL